MPTRYNKMISGNKDVAAAGTREAILSTHQKGYIFIKAKEDNTDKIFIGDITVATGSYVLNPEETLPIESDNLETLYIDSAVNGEGVYWFMVTENYS